MRGLKLNREGYRARRQEVASFTDAWIETRLTKTVNAYLSSHLLQMRGLKQMILMIFMRNIWSHLLQMRGLKLISTSLFAYRKLSHLLQMRGLKLMMYFTTTIINGSHLLQMRGLKPKPPILYNQKLCCRIFYRCVD